MQRKIVISSPPDRDAVVAEIYFDNAQFAELRKEGALFICEVYPCPENNGTWSITLSDLQQSLDAGKEKLMGDN